ncbi:hypothetical protein GW17_00024916 [Ensete ventricosum]|nr:hypothetical protein GW17_00024916 [Ensete ventricosum]
MHAPSPTLTMNSIASDHVLCGCASTSLMLGTIASKSLFIHLGVFITIASHYVFSYAPTHCTYNIDMANVDLAAKSSRPRTARPLTWPNQRNWSTGCTKDTRCRTADLA